MPTIERTERDGDDLLVTVRISPAPPVAEALTGVRKALTRACLALDADAATRERRAAEVLDETDMQKIREVTADVRSGEVGGTVGR